MDAKTAPQGVTIAREFTFLKTVLRENGLQQAKGPSVASEFGLLLPGLAADQGVGGSLSAIVSQKWEWLTVHLNFAGAVTRTRHGDLFTSVILEGPTAWPVHPVAELVEEHEFGNGHTRSALAGAIWQMNETLAEMPHQQARAPSPRGFSESRRSSSATGPRRHGVSPSPARRRGC